MCLKSPDCFMKEKPSEYIGQAMPDYTYFRQDLGNVGETYAEVLKRLMGEQVKPSM
ncbi:hypothetical protein [Pelotomaculum propionicicum]|uniref:Uncharacterized protein n=1 Tax=Pelotomaculum propionicicum TaxID=258475 RepID=A0A4Y7RLT7_9FIRM|nr:hypothetical protein [Pelotomaculum propionicicum]NLI12255.1 hypothetical protein [Peptococcaceae bacterium]TEB09958.1 hypothetical protein Pmgp_02761 [Pelotomaculum propionicicum]